MQRKNETDIALFDDMADKERGKLLSEAAKVSFEILRLLNAPHIGQRSSDFLPIIKLMER
jgi:hypothetical protein